MIDQNSSPSIYIYIIILWIVRMPVATYHGITIYYVGIVYYIIVTVALLYIGGALFAF